MAEQSSNPARKPQRVQRSRRKGRKLPEGAVYVGRPTQWGNPFVAKHRGHAKATILHKAWLDGRLGALSLEKLGFSAAEIDALTRLRARVLADLHRLAGHDLACWCPVSSEWCHAGTLLERAAAHGELERLAA